MRECSICGYVYGSRMMMPITEPPLCSCVGYLHSPGAPRCRYQHDYDSLKTDLRNFEMSTELDGLGIYNALHEVAENNGPGSRYDRGPGPMGWWAQKGRAVGLVDFKARVVEYYSDGGHNTYEEHYQGWTGGCYIIFEITPNDDRLEKKYYRLEGEVDSYNGEHWDGKFLPVSPRVENVTVYKWDDV